MKTEYDTQADGFLRKHDIRFSFVHHADRCPPYCDDRCCHGDRHRVTFWHRLKRKRLSFNFWNSLHDAQSHAQFKPYDVLACISSECTCPDTFEDFCAEYGYDADSLKAHEVFKRCSRFAKRLQAFFTEDELSELAEIQ